MSLQSKHQPVPHREYARARAFRSARFFRDACSVVYIAKGKCALGIEKCATYDQNTDDMEYSDSF